MADTIDELFTNPLKIVEDCKMIRTAVRRNWPISQEKREALIERLFRFAMNSDRDVDAIQAAKTILTADQINAKREATRAASKAAKNAKPSTINVNTAVQVNNGISLDQFRQLPLDERIRILREATTAPPGDQPKPIAGP